MIADALTWLVHGAIASTAALLCVLALRAPVRALFGARVAYGLWMLVPAALLAVSLPGPAMDFAAGGAVVAETSAAPSVRVGLATALQPLVAAVTVPYPVAPVVLLLAWACGALAMALWTWRLQRRFVSGLGALAPRGDGLFAAESMSASPAVIGAWRPRIVLPADFDARYPAAEGAVVIAHEREHVRRRDVRINLVVVILRCLHWFNPLLHWAAAKFRFDQELACDAAVLAAHPDSRRAYAGAMLKTQLAVLGLPVGCHWQSSQALKERILMLKKPQPGTLRRRGGIAAVAAVLLASSYVAWALQPISKTAPSYRGDVVEEGVALASIGIPFGLGLDITGPAMIGMPDGRRLDVILDPRSDLKIASIGEAIPWSLKVWGMGNAQSPGVKWVLTRDGRVIDEGMQEIAAGEASPLDLTLPQDAAGLVPTIVLARLPADRIVPAEHFGNPGYFEESLLRDADGAYRQKDSIRAYGEGFNADGGRAILLAHVGADGRVQRVEIERADPPGSLDVETARNLVRRNVYTPQSANGKPVPSRIRVPVEYWSEPLPMLAPVAAGQAVPDVTNSTPAPDYPADALAKKQRGGVLLHLLVATDGSVKEVRVVNSNPEGVFDAVSIEAAKKWKLQPPNKNGKPAQGWLQVPITFEPNRKPATPDAVAKPEQG